MDFCRRRLTETEISRLYVELKETPNLIGAPKEELRSLLEVIVAEEEEQLAGVTVIRDLGPDWSEITMLFVLPEYRGSGVGRQLFETAWQEIKKRERNVYVISRNPAVIRMMEKKNMRFVNLFLLPLEIQAYNLRFMLNGYRLREAVRKAFYFHGRSLIFRHGIKTRER